MWTRLVWMLRARAQFSIGSSSSSTGCIASQQTNKKYTNKKGWWLQFLVLCSSLAPLPSPPSEINLQKSTALLTCFSMSHIFVHGQWQWIGPTTRLAFKLKFSPLNSIQATAKFFCFQEIKYFWEICLFDWEEEESPADQVRTYIHGLLRNLQERPLVWVR